MKMLQKKSLLAVAATLVFASSVTSAAQIQVKITNNATANGTYLTPVWTAFHDGSFDTFNAGSAASAGLEALAEVGDTSVLSNSFSGSGVDGTIGGLIAPGASVMGQFTLSDDGSNNFFSFASMLLPSSDFFIGNDRALNISSLLDGSIGRLSFDVLSVFDAGTEVNDFTTSAGNGLFPRVGLPMSDAGQGVDQNGVVSRVNGLAFSSFLNVGSLDTSDFNFNTYASIATIEITDVSPVPVPAAALLFAPALLGFMGLRRKSKRITAV